MAFSTVTHTGNGTNGPWTLNFTLGYLSRDDISCRVDSEVDGNGDPVYRTIEWLTDTTVNIGGTAPTAGAPIIFYRTVAVDKLQHDFQNGAPIDEEHLDESHLQALMLAHEALDGRLAPLPVFPSDLNGQRIINLADGINNQDAATVGQAAASIILTPIAQQAATDAVVARDAAQAAQAAAEAAVANQMLGENNLSELTDYSVARTNLDVYSKTDVDTLFADYTTTTDLQNDYLTKADAATNYLQQGAFQFIYGLEMSMNGSNIDISEGTAYDQINGSTISLTSPVTDCILQTSGTWSAGNSANKLDTGVAASNSTYHVFIIHNYVTDTSDVLFSLSKTSPTLPSGYTGYRRLGMFVTQVGSAAIEPFFQCADVIMLKAARQVYTSTGVPWTTGALFDVISGSCRVMAHLTCYVNHGTAGAQGVRITPPEVIDATIPVELLTFATGAGGDPTSGNVSVLTDTNGQLRVRARGSTTTATIHLNGWTEDRSH